jgi:phenylacetate-CoA ligase
MYWNKEAETLKPDELAKLQEKRLKHLVNYVYDKSPFYRKKFDEQKIKPGDVKTLSDIRKLPFTMKSDLRDNYPFGLFCAHMDEIVRIHASSGTTGKMTVVGYTKNDLDTWTECMARTIVAPGGGKKDILHNAYGYGLFTGGLGFHYGAEKVGCAVIPVSGGNTKRQLMLLNDFGPTLLSCTPSYSIYLAEAAEKEGLDPKEFDLRVGIFGAEPWSEALRKRIEDAFDILATDVYGLSEISGPGVAQECEHKAGAHIWSDHFYPEIIDPKTGENVGEGEQGELVFTTLTKEGIPLIRYRTRDLTVLETDKCVCGRYHPRMMRIRGRSDDMLIIRGVNVFPSQIEHVLMKFPDIGSHYLLVVGKKGPLDTLKVQVEVTAEVISDKVRDMMQLQKMLMRELDDVLGISVDVELVEPGTIPRSEGKAVRIKDERGDKV